MPARSDGIPSVPSRPNPAPLHKLRKKCLSSHKPTIFSYVSIPFTTGCGRRGNLDGILFLRARQPGAVFPIITSSPAPAPTSMPSGSRMPTGRSSRPSMSRSSPPRAAAATVPSPPAAIPTVHPARRRGYSMSAPSRSRTSRSTPSRAPRLPRAASRPSPGTSPTRTIGPWPKAPIVSTSRLPTTAPAS